MRNFSRIYRHDLSPSERPDALIEFHPTLPGYLLPTPGGVFCIAIFHCPWCAQRLPLIALEGTGESAADDSA